MWLCLRFDNSKNKILVANFSFRVIPFHFKIPIRSNVVTEFKIEEEKIEALGKTKSFLRKSFPSPPPLEIPHSIER